MRHNFTVSVLILSVCSACASDDSALQGGMAAIDAESHGADSSSIKESESRSVDVVLALNIEDVHAVDLVTEELQCPQGASCFDIAKCILHGVCDGNQNCIMSGNVDPCEDGNVCTDDACDLSKGCVHLSNAVTCSDSNLCTILDTCAADGLCKGQPNMCNDGNACTNDGCHPSIGCVYDIGWVAYIPCEDGNVCTTNDICSGKTCAPGKPANCSDDDACTIDACVPTNNGCTHTQKNCDDKNAWTVDSCIDGGCVHRNLQVTFGANIDLDPPGDKPPVSMVPSIFLGNAFKKVFNPNDAWTPYALSSYAQGFSLKGLCEDDDEQLHWNTGYVVHVKGMVQNHVMVGGHKVTLNIVIFNGPITAVLIGEQPVLVPLSGKQE